MQGSAMSECMQVEPEHDKRQNIRTFVNGWCVFLNLKTGSVKFQRLSNVDKIVSGLSEVAWLTQVHLTSTVLVVNIAVMIPIHIKTGVQEFLRTSTVVRTAF